MIGSSFLTKNKPLKFTQQTPPIRSDIKHVPDQNTLQSPAPRMVSHKQMRKVSIEAEPDNLWVGADEEIAVEKSEVYHRSPIITV